MRVNFILFLERCPGHDVQMNWFKRPRNSAKKPSLLYKHLPLSKVLCLPSVDENRAGEIFAGLTDGKSTLSEWEEFGFVDVELFTWVWEGVAGAIDKLPTPTNRSAAVITAAVRNRLPPGAQTQTRPRGLRDPKLIRSQITGKRFTVAAAPKSHKHIRHDNETKILTGVARLEAHRMKYPRRL